MEANYGIFPLLIEYIKLIFLNLRSLFIELIILQMFLRILLVLPIYPFFNQTLYLWLQEKRYVYEIGSHRIQVTSRPFLLESLQIIKTGSQMLNFFFPCLSMLVDFLPNAIDICDLISQQ